MKKVNMHDAKTNLSRYVTSLRPGETILLCNRNEPVAEIRLIQRKTRAPRIGVARGQFEVAESFFEPLPEAFLAAFGGK